MAKVGKPPGITLNGPALREIRIARCHSVRSAAKAAGISGPTWSQYETGTRAASPESLEAICAALEISDERAIRIDTLAQVQAEVERNRARRNRPVTP